MHNVIESFAMVLTGKQAPAILVSRLGHLEDPLAIRKAILNDQALFSAIPEFRLAFEVAELRKARASKSIKLVIGAAGTSFPGWVSTNENLLNLLKPATWYGWLEEDSVDAMLSEHVWEHLDREEGIIAARTCFKFLKPGKRIRIAVPDALHPSTSYRELCKIGGNDNHKMFYNYRTLADCMSIAGFSVDLLEFWDEAGNFNSNPWSSDDGHIGRTSKHDPRNAGGKLEYTSLILDAFKPMR